MREFDFFCYSILKDRKNYEAGWKYVVAQKILNVVVWSSVSTDI